MSRLTKSGAVSQRDIDELMELSEDNPLGRNEAYFKLQHYEDLAEQGRLLELPCAEGDTVYEIVNNTDACGDCDYFSCGCYGSEDMCEKTEDFALYPQHAEKPVCEKHFMEVISHKVHLEWIILHRGKFGKTAFLTPEEAENALKEMRATNER